VADAFDAARAKLIEHQERTYVHAVVMDPTVIDSWPLERGDLTNRACRAIIEAVRSVRRARPSVTPAAILREANLVEDHAVELTVVKEGILFRPARQHLSLSERLARYKPMEAEATEMMAWDPVGAEVVE
jgi:antitoxin MazE